MLRGVSHERALGICFGQMLMGVVLKHRRLNGNWVTPECSQPLNTRLLLSLYCSERGPRRLGDFVKSPFHLFSFHPLLIHFLIICLLPYVCFSPSELSTCILALSPLTLTLSPDLASNDLNLIEICCKAGKSSGLQ